MFMNSYFMFTYNYFLVRGWVLYFPKWPII